jgi:2-phospho-L-lactate guanylyltransferase
MVLIPIKDFSKTKTRIKAGLPSKHKLVVEKLVEATFRQTLHLLNRSGFSFGVISPSKVIIKTSQQLGAEFTYLDKGNDLNEALSQAAMKLPPDKPILIVMPDLPFLSQDFMTKLQEKTENLDLLIVPSISGESGNAGTAMLYMRKPNIASLHFGKNSNVLHQKEAQRFNLKYRILEFDPFARDLDTLTDLQYLQQHLKMVNEPNQFENILENLFY